MARARQAALTALVLASFTALPATTFAQDESVVRGVSSGTTARGLQSTRADLERMASSSSGAERAMIQSRLTDGDFHSGDRIIVTVQGEAGFVDTATVRANQILQLPNLPEISLHGVLRSEVRSYLDQQIGKTIRNPRVRALPLLQIGVLGEVAKPGYYSVPADALVSDVVMVAGGPTHQADVSKSKVVRDKREIVSRDAFHQAMGNGSTVDQLSLRAGDEIVVGEASRRNWTAIGLQGLGVLSGLVYTMHAIGLF